MNPKQNHDANMNSLMTGHGNAYGEGQYQKHLPQSFRSHREPNHRQHNMMNYREAPRSPPRQTGPPKPDYDDFDPPSPEPPCGYDDDRIQNDLLDEICSDIGIKDAIDLDVFDFDATTDKYILNQTRLPEDLDSIEQTLAFGPYPSQQDQFTNPGALYPSQSGAVTTTSDPTHSEPSRHNSEAIASPTISSSCNPGVAVTSSNSRPGSVDSVADSPAVHSTSTHISHQSNMSTESHLLGSVQVKISNSPVPSPAYSQGSMGPPSNGPPSVPDLSMTGTCKPKTEPATSSIKQYGSSQISSSQQPGTPTTNLPLQSPHKYPSQQYGSDRTSTAHGDEVKSMAAPTFIPPRPVSRDRHGHVFHQPAHNEGGGQGMAEIPNSTDAGYFSTGSASVYTGSHSSHYGSSTNLSSPPDHNQATAKEKVLRYLSNTVSSNAPDFEVDNYQNGQYTMETPLGTESAVSSAPSSPPQHVAKRPRHIQSGNDLLAEMRDRYSFTKGADMYAQNNVHHQEMPLVKPGMNQGYNFSGAAGNGQAPQVPRNFNFSQTAQQPAQQRPGNSQFVPNQPPQAAHGHMNNSMNQTARPPQPGVPHDHRQMQGSRQGMQPGMQSTNFGPFAQQSNPSNQQGMYGSCPNLSSSKANTYGTNQNINNNVNIDKSYNGSMNPQGNMGPPQMPAPVNLNPGQMRGPSPMHNAQPSMVNRQFPQQVVSAPNSPSKFMQSRQSQPHQPGNVSCKNVLFRPITTPNKSGGPVQQGNMGVDQRLGQPRAPYMPGGEENVGNMQQNPNHHQQFAHQNMQQMGSNQMPPHQQRQNTHLQHSNAMGDLNHQGQGMMPPNQMPPGSMNNSMNTSMYPAQNQGGLVGQPMPSNQTPTPAMHPSIHGPPNTEVPLSQNGFMQRIMDDRSSSFRSHPLFPLLRDLIIADMNFHTPSFPFQLIANLPADFDRLLNNYLSRNPPVTNYPTNDGVQGVIMDALKYAHSALIEKIQGRKQREGYKEPDRPLSAIEDFCERFDRAVKNTMKPSMGEMPMGGPHGQRHEGNPFENPHGGMPHPNHPGNMGMPGPQTPLPPSHMAMPPGYGGGLRQFHERQSHSLPASPRKFGRHLSHDGYTSDNHSDTASNTSHEQPERKTQPTQGKNKVLPKEAVNLMLDWLRANQDNPYPNDDEKEMLIQKTKLTINQINYWFTNARRRILPKWALQRYMDQQQKQKDIDQNSGNISSSHPSSPLVTSKR